ncbi:GAF domain-containing protein [Aquipuribacter nitratireducens]|uniref:GAF domain-containing protein n=1 Tax=Aquipuribacter nitratireducens TaxID=650104 RepID=A0ABW0GL38_9MICO
MPDAAREPLDGPARPVVEESWQRCRALGVDPDHPDLDVDIDDGTLAELRREHPLSRAMPLLTRLLADDADAGHVLAVSDADGRLLHVVGDAGVRRRMAALGFTPGAVWDERHAGTNAPGTALAVDAPVQIVSGEHWATPVHPWSCSAAPVHDAEGRVVGAVDLTGGREVASRYALALVRAAVTAVEERLVQRPPAPPGGTAAGDRAPWLQLLGTDRPRLHVGERAVALTPRHAEILLLLSRQRSGVSGDVLAASLSEQLLSPVTVRAEVSRLRVVLRRALGADAVGTRPYRLLVPLRSDADDVAAAVARGAHRRALELYDGPLLPGSEAPVALSARHELEGTLRATVLTSGSTETVWRWASGPGDDDVEAWQRLVRELPYASPRRAQARARLEALRREP